MDELPSHLDGARVLEWVVRDKPLFEISEGDARHEITILAIARYEGVTGKLEGPHYLFSVDGHGEVQGDSDWKSIDDAKRVALFSHGVAPGEWRRV